MEDPPINVAPFIRVHRLTTPPDPADHFTSAVETIWVDDTTGAHYTKDHTDSPRVLTPDFNGDQMFRRPSSSHAGIIAGDMTLGSSGELFHSSNTVSWDNAMIVALGAVTSGTVKVCTLPAMTNVKRIIAKLTGSATGVTTLSFTVGRVSAAYNDYLVAADAKAAVNTYYGDQLAELGTKMSTAFGDLPSMTAPVDLYAKFTSTGGNLDSVLGSSAMIYIETFTFN